MFDKIVYISDRSANIKLKEGTDVKINLMNLHLIFEDKDKKILGEVDDVDKVFKIGYDTIMNNKEKILKLIEK